MSLDPRLERWLEALVRTPGLTSVGSLVEARRLHVDDALTALPFLEEGPVVDVGSGGGSPGLPLAVARPELDVVLLEASRRKCDFLERAAADLPNVHVVCARAEDYGRGPGRDLHAVALARALASPAVAAEWCLPLVRPGGVFVLYAGSVDAASLEPVASALAAGTPDIVPGIGDRRLVVFRKLGPTPDRFPRRPGVARKRPLLGAG